MEEFAKKDWVTIIATVHWDTLGKIAIKVQWSFILCIKEGLEYQTMNKIVSNESEKKNPLSQPKKWNLAQYMTFHCRTRHEFFILIN